MSIIGFNFLKINVERKQVSEKKINVQNNIGFTSVEETPLKLGGSNNTALRFKFVFGCQYAPNIGHISLEGEVVALVPKQDADAIVAGWKDKKRIPAPFSTKILNAALSKSQVMALLLAKEVNLPAPVPLPTATPKAASEAKAVVKKK